MRSELDWVLRKIDSFDQLNQKIVKALVLVIGPKFKHLYIFTIFKKICVVF